MKQHKTTVQTHGFWKKSAWQKSTEICSDKWALQTVQHCQAFEPEQLLSKGPQPDTLKKNRLGRVVSTKTSGGALPARWMDLLQRVPWWRSGAQVVRSRGRATEPPSGHEEDSPKLQRQPVGPSLGSLSLALCDIWIHLSPTVWSYHIRINLIQFVPLTDPDQIGKMWGVGCCAMMGAFAAQGGWRC